MAGALLLHGLYTKALHHDGDSYSADRERIPLTITTMSLKVTTIPLTVITIPLTATTVLLTVTVIQLIVTTILLTVTTILLTVTTILQRVTPIPLDSDNYSTDSDSYATDSKSTPLIVIFHHSVDRWTLSEFGDNKQHIWVRLIQETCCHITEVWIPNTTE